MLINTSVFMPSDAAAAARHALNPVSAGLIGSRILALAARVRALKAGGAQICDLTVGDFSPRQFPVPAALSEHTAAALRDGQTNYPPADGIAELKQAVADYYAAKLNLRYPPNAVCVGSGARPPLYATWRLFVEPGDRTVSFLPAWNNGYYAHLNQADHVFVPTTAEANFFPTVEQVAQVLPGARLIVLNSPLNPTGTVIDPEVLRGIATLIVEENARRGDARPCMLMFDQVYWMLTAPGFTHTSPVSLVPEIAPYVIHVDAISKCFAATGLRVGWAVMPPYLQPKMGALIGHMGAWAPKPEQIATAWLLQRPDLVDEYMDQMKAGVGARLDRLYQGVAAMAAEGLPVRAIQPQGAIYLSLHVDLIGRGFSTNQEICDWLIDEAGVAVVPFQAFDLMEETGWFRMSVGAVGLDELDGALERLRAALRSRVG